MSDVAKETFAQFFFFRLTSDPTNWALYSTGHVVPVSWILGSTSQVCQLAACRLLWLLSLVPQRPLLTEMNSKQKSILCFWSLLLEVCFAEKALIMVKKLHLILRVTE